MTWTRERWTRIEALFHELSQHDKSERSSRLIAGCGDDFELRADVLKLLAADDGDDDLIDRGVAETLRGHDPLINQRFGAFRLVERIAEGGMGAVYRAKRVEGDFQQDAAVKVLRLGLSTSAMRERFARERQTLARLVHANVARLLDGGTTELGVPFFAMELVDGLPLDRFCDEHKATLRQRLELFATTCRAVAFAHQSLIVHLDLKPSNVLVDTQSVVKLVDFGVAGLLDGVGASQGEVAVTRTRPLTPEYSSPELLRGEAVSTAADVYSLGVVLYELLTGTRAFRPTRSDLDLMRAVCETDAELPSATFASTSVTAIELSPRQRAALRSASVSEMQRALRGDLDRIVAQAMHKNPEHRYASCLELAVDIERFLGGYPVVARNDGFGYRASKFVRRNLVAVIGAAAVALALLGGIAATLRMAQIAGDERDLAATARRDAEHERDATVAAFNRAEHEAEHARIEASSSRITAAFLSDMFLSGQFLDASDQRARILATIDRKAGQMRRQHWDNEHLLANLLDALGRACTAVDAFEPAEALLTEAASMRNRHFGERSLERALSLNSLGQLYYRQGRLAEARSTLHECYQLNRELPREVHSDLGQAANDLAAAERACGNMERARELHFEALNVRRAGGDQVLIAESLNNLANSERDLASARDHLEEALRLRMEVLGADDPLTIQSQVNFGTLAIRIGDFTQACTMLRAAVEKSRGLAGLGADGLAVALKSLAYAELQCEALDAAQNSIAEALALEVQRFGPEHPRVAACLEVRAKIEERRSMWPQAVESWRQVLHLRCQALPAEHRLIALTKSSFGAALARSGAVIDGLVSIREALTLLEQAVPPAPVDVVDCKLQSAFAEDLAGKSDQAERILLEALQSCVGDSAANSRLPIVRSHLQDFYRRHGRAEEARAYEPLESDARKR